MPLSVLVAVCLGLAAIMALLVFLQPARRVRRRRSVQEVAPQSPQHLAGSGDYSYQIVGERAYQHNLESLCERTDESAEYECRALLRPDEDNTHHADAVIVSIAGLIVGAIPNEHAPVMRALIEDCGPLSCDAMIVGGWDRGARGRGYFGVRLDLDWPPRIV